MLSYLNLGRLALKIMRFLVVDETLAYKNGLIGPPFMPPTNEYKKVLQDLDYRN